MMIVCRLCTVTKTKPSPLQSRMPSHLHMLRLVSTCPLRLQSGVRCQHESIAMTKSNLWKPEFALVEGSAKLDSSCDEVKRVRLVSYNILAQSYVKSAFFPHSPPGCLKWKARSQALLDRLLSFKADFLCLQELDEFESFYKGQLDKHGYSSIYLRRPGRKKDGCGIFFKQACIELIDKEFIQYNDLVPHSDEDETTIEGSSDTESERGDPNDPKIRLKRDCVGILAAFRAKHASETVFLLANTHIYWDPEWVDVKLAQVNHLIKCILNFQRKLEGSLHIKIPVIVCGDFNSQPGDQVYNYLVSGSSVERTVANLSLKDESDPFVNRDNTMEECMLTLHSVYGAVQGEPDFTNYTPDFTGTLDYIFLSNMDSTKPVSLLQLPGRDSDDVVGGLPNHTHPSDHLPIGFDFIIRGSR